MDYAPTEVRVSAQPAPFMDQLHTQLSDISENLTRAINTLTDAGFHTDQSLTTCPAEVAQPTNKRASIIEQVRDLNEAAISLCQQVHKLA